MVRTDSSDQKLDKFISTVKEVDGNKSVLNMSHTETGIKESETQLTSVQQLRQNIKSNCHETMKELLAEHVFVGCVSTKQALIQHGVKLYLCNTEKIMEEFFNQIIFHNFGNFGTITFSKPLPLYELAMLSLNLSEANWKEEDGPKEQLAEGIVKMLIKKRLMLKEYFSLDIDEESNLLAIPLLLGKLYRKIVRIYKRMGN